MILPKHSQALEVESFQGKLGPTGSVQLHPIRGQPFPTTLLVEGNKSLVQDYPVGSRFRVQATLTDRPLGGQFLYTSWQWDVTVREPDA